MGTWALWVSLQLIAFPYVWACDLSSLVLLAFRCRMVVRKAKESWCHYAFRRWNEHWDENQLSRHHHHPLSPEAHETLANYNANSFLLSPSKSTVVPHCNLYKNAKFHPWKWKQALDNETKRDWLKKRKAGESSCRLYAHLKVCEKNVHRATFPSESGIPIRPYSPLLNANPIFSVSAPHFHPHRTDAGS